LRVAGSIKGAVAVPLGGLQRYLDLADHIRLHQIEEPPHILIVACDVSAAISQPLQRWLYLSIGAAV